MNKWYGSGHQQLRIIEQQWIQVRHDWFIKFCSNTLYCSVLTQPASTTTWVRTTTVTSSGVSWETPSTRCSPTLREHTNQSPTSRCTPQCTSVSASSTVNSCTQISWPMSGTRNHDTMNYCCNLYHQVQAGSVVISVVQCQGRELYSRVSQSLRTVFPCSGWDCSDLHLHEQVLHRSQAPHWPAHWAGQAVLQSSVRQARVAAGQPDDPGPVHAILRGPGCDVQPLQAPLHPQPQLHLTAASALQFLSSQRVTKDDWGWYPGEVTWEQVSKTWGLRLVN